jgi:hypothetical protein
MSPVSHPDRCDALLPCGQPGPASQAVTDNVVGQEDAALLLTISQETTLSLLL